MHLRAWVPDVDIWRKIGNGQFTSLGRLLGGNDADGLMSEHPPGSTSSWYEQAKFPFVLDIPQASAGTRLEYKVYVGTWGGATITMGSHRSGKRAPRGFAWCFLRFVSLYLTPLAARLANALHSHGRWAFRLAPFRQQQRQQPRSVPRPGGSPVICPNDRGAPINILRKRPVMRHK